jgi:fermentation-respiration switch protein FrsA (DUF1100 family)
MARVWAVAAAVATAGAAAMVGGCGSEEPEVAAAGTYTVETQSFTFVDDTRTTPSYFAQPERPERTIVTDVWMPSGDDGPFPLIVFNHGQQGDPGQYAPTFERWAGAGYVVAAPRHPITVRGGPGGVFIDDYMGEIGDVPFTITAIGDELGDVVDLDHVAVAGHSSGAVVAFAVGFNSCCHDDRVDAVFTEALFNVPFEGEYAPELRGTPVLFVHGTGDPHPIGDSQAAYDSSEAPRFLLPVESASHSEMYRDGPEAGPIADAALAFFDLTLKDDAAAGEVLQSIPGIQADPG